MPFYIYVSLLLFLLVLNVRDTYKISDILISSPIEESDGLVEEIVESNYVFKVVGIVEVLIFHSAVLPD